MEEKKQACGRGYRSRRRFLRQLFRLSGIMSARMILPAPFLWIKKNMLKEPDAGSTSGPGADVGFWDEGFVSGRVRTDYNVPTKGSAGNPLTLTPCLFTCPDPLIIPAGPSWDRKSCALTPTVFSRTNAYTNASSWPEKDFWVLSINNEPAYQQKYNSGPPDQSLPVSAPGKGVIGFAVKKKHLPERDFCKAHLCLDHSFAAPGSEGYIPFLAIGAHNSRGNGKPVSLLNPASPAVRQKIRFTVKMHDERNIGPKGTAGVFWFIVSSYWKQKPRMIFVALYHKGLEHERDNKKFIHGHWNWNIKESFYYPGGDLVYMDAEDISAQGLHIPRITAAGQEIAYEIDLQKLFEKASRNQDDVTFDTPLPGLPDVPVTGVHWAVEMTGKDTRLEFSVHGMSTC